MQRVGCVRTTVRAIGSESHVCDRRHEKGGKDSAQESVVGVVSLRGWEGGPTAHRGCVRGQREAEGQRARAGAQAHFSSAPPFAQELRGQSSAETEDDGGRGVRAAGQEGKGLKSLPDQRSADWTDRNLLSLWLALKAALRSRVLNSR